MIGGSIGRCHYHVLVWSCLYFQANNWPRHTIYIVYLVLHFKRVLIQSQKMPTQVHIDLKLQTDRKENFQAVVEYSSFIHYPFESFSHTFCSPPSPPSLSRIRRSVVFSRPHSPSPLWVFLLKNKGISGVLMPLAQRESNATSGIYQYHRWNGRWLDLGFL